MQIHFLLEFWCSPSWIRHLEFLLIILLHLINMKMKPVDCKKFIYLINNVINLKVMANSEFMARKKSPFFCFYQLSPPS